MGLVRPDRRSAVRLIVLGLFLALPLDYFVTIILGPSLVTDWGQIPAQIASIAVGLAGVCAFLLGCYRLIASYIQRSVEPPQSP